MRTIIYCRPTEKGIHSFYLLSEEGEFFLFSQHYRRGVQNYFGRGVYLEKANDYSKCKGDNAVIKTMGKLPVYIRFIEKEYGITVLEKSKKRKAQSYTRQYCA